MPSADPTQPTDPYATRADAGRPPDESLPADTPGLDGTRYHIIQSHARGGLGEVFLAADAQLRREVALKQMQARFADDAPSRQRFLQEAEITGRLEHPGVVPVYGLGATPDGRPFYAMRFIRGEDMQTAIDRYHRSGSGSERRAAFRELLLRFVAVCNAVAYAHSKGVIHRDIKPANVMLGPFGETLVVDWGLAKELRIADCGLRIEEPNPEPRAPDGIETVVQSAIRNPQSAMTRAGTVVGTPQFMAPEQAAGRLDEVGPASDVYSLGATLYVLLTGQPPWPGSAVQEVLTRAVAGDFPPPRQVNPRAPAALDAACRKAMALAPADRYASALDLAGDVASWLADEPVTAYRDPLSVRLLRWGRRHRTPVAAAAALLLTAVVGLAAGLVLLDRERQRTDDERIKALAGAKAERQGRRELRHALDAMTSVMVEHLLIRQTELRPEHKAFLRQALAQYEALARESGDDEEARAGVAGAHVRTANIRQKLGDADGAEADFRRAAELFTR
jgi:serine/threonine protein kinase